MKKTLLILILFCCLKSYAQPTYRLWMIDTQKNDTFYLKIGVLDSVYKSSFHIPQKKSRYFYFPVSELIQGNVGGGISQSVLDDSTAALRTDLSESGHTHTFASNTSKPTTVSGYGITDAASVSHNHVTADVTDFPTTTAGFSNSTNKNFVTDAQLTVLSNTAGSNNGDNAANTTYSNVNNTSDANKPVSTATQAALDAKQGTLSLTTTGTSGASTLIGNTLNIPNYATGGGGGAELTFVGTLASDVATGANTTPVTLTGLVFTYEANSVYRISFTGRVQPTAATTGCGFQFDLSSAVTEIDISFLHQLANSGTLSGGHSIADDASVGVSSGMPGTSTYPVTGSGQIITGANTGTAQLRFRSETTAVTTAKAGLTLIVEKVN